MYTLNYTRRHFLKAMNLGSPLIDGISMVSTLMGQPENQKKHKWLYWKFHEGKASKQAVRMHNWKAVRLST